MSQSTTSPATAVIVSPTAAHETQQQQHQGQSRLSIEERVPLKTIRFDDPAQESDYLAFIQGGGTLPAALAALFIAGTNLFAAVTSYTTALEKVAGFIAGGVSLVMAIVCAVTYKRGIGQAPHIVERWWIAVALAMSFGSIIPAPQRYRSICVQRGGLLKKSIDGTCNHFIDGYNIVAPMFLFIGTPRTFINVPILLVWCVLCNILPRFIAFPPARIYDHDAYTLLFYFLTLAMLHVLDVYSRRRYFLRCDLQEELARTNAARATVNDMLEAMLPMSVLDRLLRGEVIADSTRASVLFSDVAGFTRWSSSRPPIEIVKMVNTMYQLFDAWLIPYGVEKVTTIGDAYWVACGIPTPRDNHACRLTAFALQMLHQITEMHRLGQQYHEIFIRVGVNSGEVSGGLIGTHQIAYQVFGSVSEKAELMEQLAPTSGVLITGATLAEIIEHVGDSERPEVQAGADAVDAHSHDIIKTFVVHEFSWKPNDFATELAKMHADQSDSKLGGGGAYGVDKSHGGSHTGRQSRTGRAASSRRHSVHNETAEQTKKRVAHQRTVMLERAKAQRKEQQQMNKESSFHASMNDGSSASSGIVDLDDYKQTISARKWNWVFLKFADEQVEEEFQSFIREHFPATMRQVCIFIAIWSFALFLGVVATPPAAGSPTTGAFAAGLVILLLTSILHAVASVFVERMHAYLCFALFYIAVVLFYATAIILPGSLFSSDINHIWCFFLFVAVPMWAPGISWLFVLILNYALIGLPFLIISFSYYPALNSVTLLNLSAGAGIIWGVGMRRIEMNYRSQFIDQKTNEIAAKEAAKEKENVEAILSRTVPQFVIGELMVWLSGNREGIISHQYGDVGVVFCRMPKLPMMLEGCDATVIMSTMTNVVSMYDATVANYPSCTKVKAIGDIALIVAGLQPGQADPAFAHVWLRDMVHLGCGLSVGASTLTQESSSLADVIAEKLRNVAQSAFGAVLAGGDKHTPTTSAGRLAVGMHVGSIVGGVVGDDRLIYDVFGDTVNTTSRVMSTSGEGVWASVELMDRLERVFGGDKSAYTPTGWAFGLPVAREMKGKGQAMVVEIQPTA